MNAQMKNSSRKLQMSLTTLLIIVTSTCLGISFLVATAKSISARMSASNEARVLARYLWKENGNFNAACDAIKDTPPDIGREFIENWAPTLLLLRGETIIAYRTESVGGRTYVITNDFNLTSKKTSEWMQLEKVSGQDKGARSL